MTEQNQANTRRKVVFQVTDAALYTMDGEKVMDLMGVANSVSLDMDVDKRREQVPNPTPDR